MSKKPYLPVSLDLETLSLSPIAAVVEIGWVPIFTADAWHLNSTLPNSLLIKPSSYQDDFTFHVNEETLKFHHSQNSGFLHQAEDMGTDFRTAAQAFVDWCDLYNGEYELHLWVKGKDADIPWLTHLIKSAGLKCPWQYRNAHCLRDMSMLYPEVEQRKWGNHRAGADALAQANHLVDLALHSSRMYNFVFGGHDGN